MNNLKKLILTSSALLLGLLSISNSAFAENAMEANVTSKTNTTSVLIYINPVFYEHPVRMLHPYLDYWHMRGPMFEKIAVEALNNKQINAQTCKSNADTNLTISLEPYIFYNPQMRVFHSEVIANVYAGKLEPIATYKASAQQQGELNNVADYYLKLAYKKAMQGIVTKMQADTSKLNNIATLDNNVCSLLNNVPTTRKYF